MDVIKKNIAAKILLWFAFVFVLLAAADYFGREFIVEYVGNYYILALLGLAFISAFLLFLFIFTFPFRKVFREMKALLTGHQYKKIFTQRIDEVGVLAHFFNEVTKNLERIAVDVEEGRRMSKELSVGSDIQRKILPTAMPDIPGIKIFGNTRPASEVGGDSFDIIPAGDNTYIYVGDVTGHGLPAGLIMVMVNTLIRTFSEINPTGYDIIVNTNRVLKQRIEPRRFMTCVLLRWAAREGKLYYTGAGHEHIMIYRKAQGVCEVKQTGGIALGMVPDASKIVREEEIPLAPRDYVVLYSDGIVEAKNMSGEMFGVPRLKNSIEAYASACLPQDLFTQISRDLASFVGNHVQEDDVTLIALQKA
ncbi:serine/threonine-protein phosphatase [Candidatus Peregrinibacteria bacterium]|nr:serine/threonine-protein phosphatase [Candidatus Peregrinibacteria bacterium]